MPISAYEVTTYKICAVLLNFLTIAILLYHNYFACAGYFLLKSRHKKPPMFQPPARNSLL